MTRIGSTSGFTPVRSGDGGHSPAGTPSTPTSRQRPTVGDKLSGLPRPPLPPRPAALQAELGMQPQANARRPALPPRPAALQAELGMQPQANARPALPPRPAALQAELGMQPQTNARPPLPPRPAAQTPQGPVSGRQSMPMPQVFKGPAHQPPPYMANPQRRMPAPQAPSGYNAQPQSKPAPTSRFDLPNPYDNQPPGRARSDSDTSSRRSSLSGSTLYSSPASSTATLVNESPGKKATTQSHKPLPATPQSTEAQSKGSASKKGFFGGMFGAIKAKIGEQNELNTRRSSARQERYDTYSSSSEDLTAGYGDGRFDRR